MPKPNVIRHIPNNTQSLTVRCWGCGAERIEAFQCTCGKKFCRSCSPTSFQQDEFGETLHVTCPSCKTETIFI